MSAPVKYVRDKNGDVKLIQTPDGVIGPNKQQPQGSVDSTELQDPDIKISPQVRRHGGDIFGKGGIKDKNSENYQNSSGLMGGLPAWGAADHKTKYLKDIYSNTNKFQELLNSFDPVTGKYTALSGMDRMIYGVSDADITSYALHQDKAALQAELESTGAIRDLREARGTASGKDAVTTLDSRSEIEGILKDHQSKATLKQSILKLKEGPEALAARKKALGRDLTAEELTELKIEVDNKVGSGNPGARQTEVHEDTLDTNETKRQTAEITAEANRTTAQASQTNAAANTRNAGTNELNAINAGIRDRNSNKIEMAKIEHNNNVAEYNYRTNLTKIRNDTAIANADRELRRDLAVLGLQDRATDRRYNREEAARDRRQQMILQLMTGLSNAAKISI